MIASVGEFVSVKLVRVNRMRNGEEVKVHRKMEFEEMMELQVGGSTIILELVGVLHHIGNSPVAGHVVCSRKIDGLWELRDDSRMIRIGSVRNQTNLGNGTVDPLRDAVLFLYRNLGPKPASNPIGTTIPSDPTIMQPLSNSRQPVPSDQQTSKPQKNLPSFTKLPTFNKKASAPSSRSQEEVSSPDSRIPPHQSSKPQDEIPLSSSDVLPAISSKLQNEIQKSFTRTSSLHSSTSKSCQEWFRNECSSSIKDSRKSKEG